MPSYEDRGVSPHKPDVKKAILAIDQGLYPKAFCKAIPDIISNQEDYCFLLHADGAGTKSSLAYLQYKENNDPSVFRGIAQDSLVMNLDDLLCVGALGPFILSNTIGRNYKLIDGEIIKQIIEGYQDQANLMKEHGIDVVNCGGETADLGDLVRTVIIDSTIAVRMKRSHFIDASLVKPDQVIVGLSSSGQATYETKYNSGIGTNGFTSARHEVLNNEYPESFAPEIYDLAYTGKFKLSDKLKDTPLTVGEALLSPTRTYAPILKLVLDEYRDNISAIFHNSGGGQTKCINFGENIRYVKDNLFNTPPIFNLIRESNNLSNHEMYRVYNMGSRMEIVCDSKVADKIIDISNKFKVDAQVIGRTEKSDKTEVLIKTKDEEIKYE